MASIIQRSMRGVSTGEETTMSNQHTYIHPILVKSIGIRRFKKEYIWHILFSPKAPNDGFILEAPALV